jgi:hypothetical protein
VTYAVACLVVFAVLTEVASSFFAPRLLASLALLPLGRARCIPLPPGASNALARIPTTAGDYRSAPALLFDVAGLLDAPAAESKERVLWFSATHGDVIARLRFSAEMARPFVRVAVHAERERLVLQPRFFPSPLFFAGLGILVLCAAGDGLLLSLCGIFIALAYFAQRVRARALADAVEAAVASRVRALAVDVTADGTE